MNQNDTIHNFSTRLKQLPTASASVQDILSYKDFNLDSSFTPPIDYNLSVFGLQVGIT
jgi:hypothetical protein